MNLLQKEIVLYVEEISARLGFFHIETIIKGDSRARVIQVFIDGEKSVTAEDCAQFSRELNEAIETNNLISENYRLEVSSPGVDRPLKYFGQFIKHIGRKFEIEFVEGGSLKKIEGKLELAENGELSLLQNKEIIKIKFIDIKKAKVKISF